MISDFLLLSIIDSKLRSLSLGPWSDRVGRKYALVMSMSGVILEASVYLICHYIPSLPVEYSLIGSLMEGLAGGTIGLFALCAGYISDITTLDNRTFRMTIVFSMYGLGKLVGIYVGGAVYKDFGYDTLFWIWLISNLITLIYAMLRLENVVPKGSNEIQVMTKKEAFKALLSLKHLLTAMKLVARKREGHRRGAVWSLIIVMAIGISVLAGE